MERKRIGEIGNEYGALHIKQCHGRFFWSIEGICGHDWQEIPKSLFDELNKFEDEKDGE